MNSTHWSQAGYHRIVTAQTLSSIGDRISYVVVPFALLSLGFDVGTIALVLAARAVAYGLVVLYGGVLADRIDCVRLMVSSDMIRFTTQTITMVMVLMHVQTVMPFIVTQALFGFAEACFNPAAGRLFADVVPDEKLENANGYYNTAVNFGMVFGPILGGFLVASGKSPLGLAIDAVSFLVSAVILRGIHSPSRPESSSRTSLRTELLDGWAALISQRWLLVIMLASGAFHLLSLSAVFALGPAYAEDHLRGSSGWGILVAAFGAGGIIGGIISSKFRPKNAGIAILISLIALSSQPFVLASGLNYFTILAWQFLNGIALSFFSVVYSTTTQRYVPRDTLGRVGSFDELTISALMPLGYLCLGLVATRIGTGLTMEIASSIAMLVCASLLISPSIRRMNSLVSPNQSC